MQIYKKVQICLVILSIASQHSVISHKNIFFKLVEEYFLLTNGFWSRRIEKLVDDLSQQVASLKNLLMSNQNLAEERFPKANLNPSPNIQSAEISTMDPEANPTSYEDRNGHSSSRAHVKHSSSPEEDKNAPVRIVPRKCIMSLDISEYELQMLEIQARQEDNDEESILAFEVRIFSGFF